MIRRADAFACALGAAALLGAPARADEFTQHAAHEHGRATLDVAVDGGRVEIRLASPAIDVLGFEHAPRTTAEKQAVADANARLGANAFEFPVAAKCTRTDAGVTTPDWRDPGGHADYEARWAFTCTVPSALTFVDATFVAQLQPGTSVEANVITDALQTRQRLRAGVVRVRLR